jgi:transketolase
MKRSYILDQSDETKDMYAAYNEAVVELADRNDKIVLLYADYPSGSAGDHFRNSYSERIYDFGIAEANLMSIAAGLAATGKIPFTHCHSIFAVGRAYNQIRQNIAYDRFNVKIILPASGMLSYVVGASHQTIEDTAALRVIPNLVLVCPADPVETKIVIKSAVEYDGPVAIRLARTLVPSGVSFIYKEDFPFELGKAVTMIDGEDITIIGSGMILTDCIQATEMLAEEGINARLLDMHTIKPIDEEAIIKSARETGAIVTVEDVSIIGGLGGAVAEVIVQNHSVPVRIVGVKDRFGQSGNIQELKEEYEISSKHIAQAVRDLIAGKRVTA